MEEEAYSSDMWWVPEERTGEPHQCVAPVVCKIRDDRDGYVADLKLYEKVYSDCPRDLGYSTEEHTPDDSMGEYEGEITLNITRSMVSAVTSKVTKNKPLPVALTTRGDFYLHQQGKKLSQWVDGDFKQNRVFQTTSRMATDAQVYGTAFSKHYVGGSEDEPLIVTERVNPKEIFVDAQDSRRGYPRAIYQICSIDRHLLCAQYPEDYEGRDSREDIFSSDGPDDAGQESSGANLVEVYEAWRLPSSPGAGDGRHVMCTTGTTLIDEEWEFDWFPFSHIRWSDEPDSWEGRGLVSELMPIQGEINRIASHIQESFHMGSNFIWAIENGSEVKSEHINNRPATIIRFDKIVPQRIVEATVHPEVFAHLDRLWGRAFDIAGVSELAVAARKPVGLDSGKALRTFSDIGSERFARFGTAWEDLHLDIAEKRIALARQLQRAGVKVRVTHQSRFWKEEIEFPDLKEESFSLKMTPVSALSTTLTGRLAEVQDMVSLGVTKDPVQIRRLLQLPDIDADYDLETAMRELAEKVVSDIVLEKKSIACEPEWDTAVMKSVAKMHLALAYVHGLDEATKDLLREFLKSCVDQENKAMEGALQPPENFPGAQDVPAAPAATPELPPAQPVNPMVMQ